MHDLKADRELAKQIVDALVRDYEVVPSDAAHAETTIFTIIRRYVCGWYESNPNS